jgi:hypothetical protein
MKQRIENLLNNVRLVERELEDILEELSASSVKPSPKNVRKLNLAFIVGHTASAPGAGGSGIIKNEYFYHKELMVPHIKAFSGNVNIMIYYRDGVGITGAYKLADEGGADCVIELHYNGAASVQATGTETLYASDKGKMLAESVQQRMMQTLKLRDRGVKYIPPEGRGGMNLRAGRAPAIIVEPGFGSNVNDATVLRDKVKELAEAYILGAMDYWEKVNATG